MLIKTMKNESKNEKKSLLMPFKKLIPIPYICLRFCLLEVPEEKSTIVLSIKI